MVFWNGLSLSNTSSEVSQDARVSRPISPGPGYSYRLSFITINDLAMESLEGRMGYGNLKREFLVLSFQGQSQKT